MVRLWGAGLLIALGGCTSTPAPMSAPVAVLAQPVNIRPEAISIQGPMGLHPELMQAFDELQQRGEMVAPARAAERLSSYYRWHGWRNVEVRPPKVQGDGTLLLTVDALAPGPYPDLPAPTAILRENELLSGSGRLLAQLDQDLQPWLDSDSRILVDVEGRRLLFKDWQSGIIEFPVAVGGPGRTTPSGTYTVENVTRYPTWYPPESLPLPQTRPRVTQGGAPWQKQPARQSFHQVAERPWNPRHQPAEQHWSRRQLGLYPHARSGRQAPSRAPERRRPRYHRAPATAAGLTDRFRKRA